MTQPRSLRWIGALALVLMLFAWPSLAADNGLTLFTVSDGSTQEEYSVKLQILLLMTALSFLPAFILMATSSACNRARPTASWSALRWRCRCSLCVRCGAMCMSMPSNRMTKAKLH